MQKVVISIPTVASWCQLFLILLLVKYSEIPITNHSSHSRFLIPVMRLKRFKKSIARIYSRKRVILILVAGYSYKRHISKFVRPEQFISNRTVGVILIFWSSIVRMRLYPTLLWTAFLRDQIRQWFIIFKILVFMTSEKMNLVFKDCFKNK